MHSGEHEISPETAESKLERCCHNVFTSEYVTFRRVNLERYHRDPMSMVHYLPVPPAVARQFVPPGSESR